MFPRFPFWPDCGINEVISDIVENIRCVGSFEDIEAADRNSVRNRSETFF